MSGTPVTINKLEFENVKRVKAVKIEPTASGLTIVGGNNGQGKTSVLDAIAWALGGNKHRPSQAYREGSAVAPTLKVTLSNGLIVERKGKNSDLKITDPSGTKASQNLLDSFVNELAINLPKFMQSTSKEKAQTLLQIIGIGPQLAQLELQENELYQERLMTGRIMEQKEKYAKEQRAYNDMPDAPIDASELIQQQGTILAQNGENQRKRQRAEQLDQQLKLEMQQIEQLENQLNVLKEKHAQTMADSLIANTDAKDLQDQSTEALKQNLQDIEEINRKVRANLDKEKAEEDAKDYRTQYNTLTGKIESVRKQKTDLLDNANLPLPGLSVDDGELIYNNQKWDNMSSSEQLRVSTAIVRKLKPASAFILLDKLEQMDMQTLNEFGAWLEQEGLQAIATRVSTGEECSIIIEDGYVKGQELITETPVVAYDTGSSNSWTSSGGGF